MSSIFFDVTKGALELLKVDVKRVMPVLAKIVNNKA